MGDDAAGGSGRLLDRLASGELRELLRLLGRSDVEELELELGGTRLSFKREARAASTTVATPPTADERADVAVRAEQVGFFHFLPEGAAPRPDERVEVGQALGTIDALNVPSPVQAPCSGRIAQVPVEDGQGVEYGQVLFVIEPE